MYDTRTSISVTTTEEYASRFREEAKSLGISNREMFDKMLDSYFLNKNAEVNTKPKVMGLLLKKNYAKINTKDSKPTIIDDGSIFYEFELLSHHTHLERIINMDSRMYDYFSTEYGVNIALPETKMYQCVNLYRIFSAQRLFSNKVKNDGNNGRIVVNIVTEVSYRMASCLRVEKSIFVSTKEEIINTMLDNGVNDKNIEEIQKLLPNIEI